MRTGIGLAFIGLGAILAFAVKGSPSFLNLHTVGWVLMIIGLVGLVVPRRTYGWLGRRIIRRTYPGGQVIEEVPVPPYTAVNPGTQRIDAGLGPEPTLLEDAEIDPVIAQPEPVVEVVDPARPRYRTVKPPVQGRRTEVIEDLYEQP
jgi:hypothetical protein